MERANENQCSRLIRNLVKTVVQKSSLLVVLGNGVTEDSNNYVDVLIALTNHSFPAKLHVLELP